VGEGISEIATKISSSDLGAIEFRYVHNRRLFASSAEALVFFIIVIENVYSISLWRLATVEEYVSSI